MMYPLVTDLADEGIPVALTCRVLGFSKQGYFKWRAKPICDRDLSDAYLINDAIDAHRDDPGFGYRFISDELEALGHEASENRVQRLCSLQRIWSVHSKKRGTQPPAGPARPRRPGPAELHGSHDQRAVADRHLRTPDRRRQALSLCHQGRLLHSDRRLFHGCSHAGRPRCRRPQERSDDPGRGPDAIVHSDRGSQFRSRAFVRTLKDAELRGSMGRVGTCADNAAMESFFALLQKNVLNSKRWKTREELRLAIATWIEKTYNRRRRQRGLGRLTPVEYETIYSVAKAA